MRSSARRIAARAASRSPARRSSSARSAPMTPRNWGSSMLTAATSTSSSSDAGPGGVALAEGELGVAQGEVHERRAGDGPGVGQVALGIGPVAGVQRDLGLDRADPRAVAAGPGRALGALVGDGAALFGAPALVQEVGEVDVGRAHLGQAPVLDGEVERLAQLARALVDLAEGHERRAHRIERAAARRRLRGRLGRGQRVAGRLDGAAMAPAQHEELRPQAEQQRALRARVGGRAAAPGRARAWSAPTRRHRAPSARWRGARADRRRGRARRPRRSPRAPPRRAPRPVACRGARRPLGTAAWRGRSRPAPRGRARATTAAARARRGVAASPWAWTSSAASPARTAAANPAGWSPADR